MAKFYGAVGFGLSAEAAPGVWEDRIVERHYYGDVTRNAHRTENGESVNDNVRINNLISIVADSYAIENLYAIRYVQWMGTRWKLTDIDVQLPRLILTIGGVYNGPTP